jgi:RND family efflux transporter MFP subunit
VWLLVPVALAALIPLAVQLGSRAPGNREPLRIDEEKMPGPSARILPEPTPTRMPDRNASETAALALPTTMQSALVVPAGGGALAELDCVVEPWVTVNVGSPVEALIEEITVDRSDYVEAGDVLVELDAGVEAATVEVARMRAKASGELHSRETSLELGQRRKERMDELFRRDAISLEIQDEVDTDAALATHQLQAARENRRVAALELRQALEILERRTIRSPVSGYVVERRMSPGEVVDEETILTVAQVDPLRVEVIAPSTLYGQIEVGMKAEVHPELPPGAIYQAEVTLVDRVIDAASGTFGVRLDLANPDHLIPGGLRCRVRFLPGVTAAKP